jgi:hypothetical protein
MAGSARPHEMLPAAPVGYETGCLEYHPVTVLNVAAAIVFVVMLPLLSVMTLGLQGRLSIPIEVPLDFVAIGAMFGASVATLFLHELIHGLVLRCHKHRVSYGLDIGKLIAYTAAFRQFQPRDHALASALAPLILINLTMLPLLAVPNRYVVSIAFSVLLTNTPGAVGDIYLAWRLLHLPRHALLYDLDPASMLVYLPSCR